MMCSAATDSYLLVIDEAADEFGISHFDHADQYFNLRG